MGNQIYILNGGNFSTLEAFADEFTRALNLEIKWNGNLDAFHDILRGGFGTPADGFVLVWKHSQLSRKALGYAETVRWLEERVQHCHPANVEDFKKRLDAARHYQGSTLFDWIIDIIQDEEHRDIELRLE